MKKIAVAVAIALFLVPVCAFAQSDADIRSSVLQQLLSTFVVEVNSLDKIQSLISQSSDPHQFDSFTALVAKQLSETTAQISLFLTPDAPATGGPSESATAEFVQATPVPTVIKVATYQNKYPEVAGNHCDAINLYASVLDQNGKEMEGQAVTLTSPSQTMVATTSQTDYRRVNFQALFQYWTPTVAGTDNLVFSSGNLSTTFPMHVRDVSKTLGSPDWGGNC